MEPLECFQCALLSVNLIFRIDGHAVQRAGTDNLVGCCGFEGEMRPSDRPAVDIVEGLSRLRFLGDDGLILSPGEVDL